MACPWDVPGPRPPTIIGQPLTAVEKHQSELSMIFPHSWLVFHTARSGTASPDPQWTWENTSQARNLEPQLFQLPYMGVPGCAASYKEMVWYWLMMVDEGVMRVDDDW